MLNKYIERDVDVSQEETQPNIEADLEIGAHATMIVDECAFREGSEQITHKLGIRLLVFEPTETIDDVSLSSDMTREQLGQIKSLLTSYQDVLTDVPGRTNLGEH